MTERIDVLNPVDIETRIRDIAERIANSAGVCNDRYKAFMQADHAYDLAHARAWLNAEGTVKDKEATVEIETEDERQARDVAEVAYKYADRLAKALESELRAYQSVGASVRQMFAVAGRGEQ
ncbi:hypothetical protein NYO98_10620 [Nocardioides sp. STR2]|uniref:PE family protein n=1 Tax=Nocardioides pini TaxID=2975053 RepID=A0ABT4CFV2_9ACTN|nr:hypothetical protein [Nocardioides pini]MCY4726732.1 hypothetical protein [Nocardioides pini]